MSSTNGKLTAFPLYMQPHLFIALVLSWHGIPVQIVYLYPAEAEAPFRYLYLLVHLPNKNISRAYSQVMLPGRLRPR